jgi:hypothetical protein
VYMVDMANDACKKADAAGGGLECQQASGHSVTLEIGGVAAISPIAHSITLKRDGMAYEYEPYYGHTTSDVARDQTERESLLGSGAGTSGIFRKVTTEKTEVGSTSIQLPPKDAR